MSDSEKHTVLLHKYTVASADMRYITINEREIYLHRISPGSYIIRGEMPGCDESCHANLSQTLLEYVLDCEGCADTEEAAEEAQSFGWHMGEVLAKTIKTQNSEHPLAELAAMGVECILSSLEVPYEFRASGGLHYRMQYSPLPYSAEQTATQRGIALAQQALISMVKGTLRAVSPDYTLLETSPDFTTITIQTG